MYAALIVAGLVAAGCAPAPSATSSELVYLRVGVDLAEESDEVISQLTQAGWSLRQRIDRRAFVAIGVGRGDERAVRVITERGLALALPSIGTEGEGRRFIVDDTGTGGDLDGDRTEDIAIGELTGGGRACLTLYRVDQARLQILPATLEGWSPTPCVEAVRDVVGSPTLEALAVIRFPDLAADDDPKIVVPLEYREGRFVQLAPVDRAAHIEAERTRRTAELRRGDQEVNQTYRIAVELAALGELAGVSSTEQLETFDEALAGASRSPELSTWIAKARTHIAAQWQRPESGTEQPPTAPSE